MTSLDATQILLILGGIGVLIGTLTTSIVTIIQAARASRAVAAVADSVAAVDKKVEVVTDGARRIEKAVNSVQRQALKATETALQTVLGLQQLNFDRTGSESDKMAAEAARLAVVAAAKAVADHDEQQVLVNDETRLQLGKAQEIKAI